ncbi:GntP family permease [Stratiformator vulcanicus]|uniref:Low-affinity gluconate transporter n=1 Tax=Stratiformator vulcanicus TaxID=2527980 RepID=A0A517R4Y8_9PLAN|nr:SLC13 family permease [Stratiformator vulcanicus]QDT38932.1 Low-affinity gluconate transporter [Stratiformator vulcanicus]
MPAPWATVHPETLTMDYYPLIVLAIGIAIVLGMILALRINAFLALLTAAFVVSLLAPGEVGDKISRVAGAFGSACGGIGIVIALAAIIGTCLMESGAADRIVRSFLNTLGEKRAASAMMGSGFVLAVPVFFDTVFYLLVPLARSLYRRTGKHYVLYVSAIACGAGITHTLVPPTPGPLIIAANLGVDIGVMILAGICVAMPAAFVGLLYCGFADRSMGVSVPDDITDTESPPPSDENLPGLGISLVPIILPVLLVSLATGLSTFADAERAAALTEGDVSDWSALRQQVESAEENTPGGRIRELADGTDLLAEDASGPQADAWNKVLSKRGFYDPAAFAEQLPPKWEMQRELDSGDLSEDRRAQLEKVDEVYSLLAGNIERMPLSQVQHLNRLLLELSYPDLVGDHEWDTPVRQAATYAGLIGNANFALFLSAAVSILLYVTQRKPDHKTFTNAMEHSLMSGGMIILITAAGGAFGAMLQQAQVGDAIRNLFAGESGDASGLAFLALAFGIASLIKVAQGSSTTAMIITSGMLGAALNAETLGFHPVYLATSIGAGSLVGVWMNDSGFWIVAKMGGFSAADTLKTLSITLAILGVTSFLLTCLYATVLPLA